jgi:hypothetical protein
MVVLIIFIAMLFVGWHAGGGLFDLFFGKPEKDDWDYPDHNSVNNDYSTHTHFHVHNHNKSDEKASLNDVVDKLNEETIDVDHKEL